MAALLKRLSPLVVVVLVLAFGSACGADGGGAAGTSDAGAATNSGGGQAQQRVGHHRVGCWGASAALAGEEGVRFVVRCKGSEADGFVHFSVSRSGFAGVDHHPTVSGPGTLAPHGHCRRERKQLIDCKARAKGAVTVTGRAEVSAEGRCTQLVSITTTAASKCNGPTCPTQVTTVELWSGKPRGC